MGKERCGPSIIPVASLRVNNDDVLCFTDLLVEPLSGVGTEYIVYGPLVEPDVTVTACAQKHRKLTYDIAMRVVVSSVDQQQTLRAYGQIR